MKRKMKKKKKMVIYLNMILANGMILRQRKTVRTEVPCRRKRNGQETEMIGAIQAHPINERLYRRTGLTWVSGIKLIMMISCRQHTV
ncbi:uncharacterized protein LOC115233077 isoform X2 [Formica exsecta]|nr:uncharacterized protein LOC115233077 isoform X2 [Formica exsecta]